MDRHAGAMSRAIARFLPISVRYASDWIPASAGMTGMEARTKKDDLPENDS